MSLPNPHIVDVLLRLKEVKKARLREHVTEYKAGKFYIDGEVIPLASQVVPRFAAIMEVPPYAETPTNKDSGSD